MRNQPKPLTVTERMLQATMHTALEHRDGPVTLSYVKRDGSTGSSTGTVAFFNGRVGFDTGSVTIATADKGNRTINLHRITEIV